MEFCEKSNCENLTNEGLASVQKENDNFYKNWNPDRDFPYACLQVEQNKK